VAFLYGDSTESGLELNYIEFLKAALDFAVQVLMADHRVQSQQLAGEEKKGRAEAELGQLRELSEAVGRTLDGAPGDPGGAARRCAATLRAASQDAVKKAAGMVKARLAEELAAMTQQIQRERQVAGRALEQLLLQHDLPGASRALDLTLDPGGTSYAATMRGRADVGLDWVLELAIPGGSLFSQPLKLERIAPHLEIRVPESGGWMRKGVRMKTQRLGAQYLVALGMSGQQTTFKLRGAPQEDEAGYNVMVAPGQPPIRLVRVSKGGEHSPPFEPLDEDIPRLLELTAQLRLDLSNLAEHRKQLVEGRLDGKPLAEHDGPSLAVRRLITKMAPVVQEIARRSLSPDELILKRVLADDRREEIFVAKADLTARLDPVPPALRALFSPLGLGDPFGGPAPGEVLEGRPSSEGEGEGEGETKEIYIGRPSAVEIDIDHPTSIEVADDTESRAALPTTVAEPPRAGRPSEPPPRGRSSSAPPVARDRRVSEPPLRGRRSSAPPAAEAREARTSEPPPRELPRASEVLRARQEAAGGLPHAPQHGDRAPITRPGVPPPPGADDDDVTTVSAGPPKPPGGPVPMPGQQPAAPPAAASPAAPPAAPAPPAPADSIDVALSELERESDRDDS
jgi:hypothetical protein